MPYNLQQIAFSLSSLAGLVNNKVQGWQIPNLQAYLSIQIASNLAPTSAVGKLLGPWSVVWGPSVYLDPIAPVKTAAQTAYVAKGIDPATGSPVYVLSIAGSNPRSPFDRAYEDGDMAPTAWPLDATSPTGYVTAGTAIGVAVLESMRDPSTQDTLATFLSSVANPDATLVITGHSLGGALAPALALSLLPQVGTWKAVRVLPTGGPSTTDKGFVSDYLTAFPPVHDGTPFGWNQNVTNSMDVISLAWADMDALPSLYPQIPTGTGLGTWYANVVTHVGKTLAPFRQVAPLISFPSVRLPGQFVTPEGPAPKPLSFFLLEAAFQHVYAFHDVMGTQAVRDALGIPSPLDPDAEEHEIIELGCGAIAAKYGSSCDGLCDRCL